MKLRLPATALMLSVLLAACSQEAPPAPGADGTAGQAPVAVRIGDDAFSMSPGGFRICEAENGAITSTAKWDVADRGIGEISIYVIDASGNRKLWLTAGPSGESTTGPWVFPDTRFELVDRASDGVIASLKVEASPCG